MVRESYYIEGERVCEYEIDEKSGGSEAWTVIREEGKLVFVLGTPGWRGMSIDVCRKEGVGGPTHTVGERPKLKRRICTMELENAEGG